MRLGNKKMINPQMVQISTDKAAAGSLPGRVGDKLSPADK